MENKALIAVVVVLALAVVGLAGYIVGTQKARPAAGPASGPGSGGAGPSGGTGVAGGSSNVVISAHFETFPAGTELKQGMQGTVTDEFKAGDLVGISGETNVTGHATISLQVLDQAGNVVIPGIPGVELNGPGGFGMCCIPFPSVAGSYAVRILVDGAEAMVLPFKVVG